MRSGADAFERVDFPRRRSKKTALVQLAVPTSFLINLLSSITRNITRLSVHYIPVNPRIIPQRLLHLSKEDEIKYLCHLDHWCSWRFCFNFEKVAVNREELEQ